MDLTLKERVLEKASKLCRVFIGIVFLIAGLSKMTESSIFVAQVSILTRSLIGDGFGTIIPTLLAFIIPPLEVILGVSLIVDLRPEITGRVAVGFMALFVAITFWLWVKRISSDCGCFGSLLRRSPYEAMIEDVILLFIASLGLIKIRKQALESRFEWKVYLVLGVGIGTLAINGVCLVCFG